MPVECLIGQMICHRLFFSFLMISAQFHWENTYLPKKNKKVLFLGFYGRSSYFAPLDTQKSMGILEIDLELFWINFFKVALTLSRCVRCPERFFAWQDFLMLTNVVHWPNPRKLVFYLKCGYVVGWAKRYFCKKFKTQNSRISLVLANFAS